MLNVTAKRNSIRAAEPSRNFKCDYLETMLLGILPRYFENGFKYLSVFIFLMTIIKFSTK